MTYKTRKEYEALALSRMTGESIAGWLSDEEAEEYYRLMEV